MNETSFEMFKLASSGFCCTQIMMKLALDEEEKENEDLIRAVNGLCAGIGYTKKTCGVITGGIGIIGLYAGKGSMTEFPKENYSEMIKEYISWFENEFNSTDCEDLIGIYNITDSNGNVSYPVKCGDILLKGYEKVQEILYRHNYDFGSRD